MPKYTKRGGKYTRTTKADGEKYPPWKSGDGVTIEFGISKCKFLSSYPPQLKKALSAMTPGFMFMQQYKSGHWDGRFKFITVAGYFPTGLLPLVYAILKTKKNPLNGQTVFVKEMGKVGIKIPPKLAEYFSPLYLRHYLDKVDIIESIDEKERTVDLPEDTVKLIRKSKSRNQILERLNSLLDSF